jgi:hypothetical protein
VDVLQTGPLNAQQQETIQVLRTEILALSRAAEIPANGSPPTVVGEKT